MSIIILILIAVGVLLWLVRMIPMDATIHLDIRVVVLIAVALWLLRIFGLLGTIESARI